MRQNTQDMTSSSLLSAQAAHRAAYCAMRNFLVKSEMRSPNLGTAAIALSNVLLAMVYFG